ncbi:MAG TPA: hypothetical protein VIR30_01300 [Nocardioides sp.]
MPTPRELELRKQINARLDAAYRRMRSFPAIEGGGVAPETLDDCATRIYELCGHLNQAELALRELQTLEGLSTESAWAGGGVDAIIKNLRDGAALLAAQVDVERFDQQLSS